MAITDDVKLSIYNKALLEIGGRQLSSVTENRKPRRVFDTFWGADNSAVKLALGRAGWNFAMRSVLMEADPSLDTEFGETYAYSIPEDYVRLEALSADPNFDTTFTEDEYQIQGSFWLTDHEVIYAKYVSSGDQYGMNSGIWPESFRDYLAFYLAFRSSKSISNSLSTKDYLGGEMKRALSHAKSRDSMDESTKMPQSGNWVRSRQRTSQGERGNKNRLHD